MNGSPEEKLPLFVVREGDGLRLLRAKAWIAAILWPPMSCLAGYVFLVAFLRIGMGYQLDTDWYASSARITVQQLACFFGISFALVLRQDRAIRQQVAKLPWHQFSIRELLVMFTGFAVSFAIAGASHRAQLAKLTPTELLAWQLRPMASNIIGPDGGIQAKGEGLEIWIQDPTFDDQRLNDLTDLAREHQVLDKISALRFSPWADNRLGTATWPAVTSDSIETLDQWPSLKLLEARRTSLPKTFQDKFSADTTW